MDRLVPHIQAFDAERDSSVFRMLYAYLSEEVTPQSNHDVIEYYARNIRYRYQTKKFHAQILEVFTNYFLHRCSIAEADALYRVLGRCKAYSVSMSLKAFADAVFGKENEVLFFQCLLPELIAQEKFKTYIKKIVQSRLIDFTRSKAYGLHITDELEDAVEMPEDTGEEDAGLFSILNEEQKLINKLKYGFSLDNQEFVSVMMALDYDAVDILKPLSSEEKFYIKMKTKYALSDEVPLFKQFDVADIQKSIEKKIKKEREKLRSYSYNDYTEDEKKEIYFKLLYAEAMSAREIGVILHLSAKQVDKKIENSKKRLKRMQ